METKIRINANLSETMYKKMKFLSEETGLTMSALVTVAVMSYMDQKEVLKLNDLYKKLQDEEEKSK